MSILPDMQIAQCYKLMFDLPMSHFSSTSSREFLPVPSINPLTGIEELMEVWRESLLKHPYLTIPSVLIPIAPCPFLNPYFPIPAVFTFLPPESIKNLEQAQLYCFTSPTFRALSYTAGCLFDPRKPEFPQRVHIPPASVDQFFSSWYCGAKRGSYDDGAKYWIRLGKEGYQSVREQWKQIWEAVKEEYEREERLGMVIGVKKLSRRNSKM